MDPIGIVPGIPKRYSFTVTFEVLLEVKSIAGPILPEANVP